MRRFKSAGQAQRFLSAHGPINNAFRCQRNPLTAEQYRHVRMQAFSIWNEATSRKKRLIRGTVLPHQKLFHLEFYNSPFRFSKLTVPIRIPQLVRFANCDCVSQWVGALTMDVAICWRLLSFVSLDACIKIRFTFCAITGGEACVSVLRYGVISLFAGSGVRQNAVL